MFFERPPTREEIEEIADDYIALKNHPDSREFRKAMDEHRHPLAYVNGASNEIVENWPLAALDLIEEILKKTDSEYIIALLGAGFLEDLLHYHPEQVIDAIEVKARHNVKFRESLSGVWPGGIPKEIWERVDIACGRSEPKKKR